MKTLFAFILAALTLVAVPAFAEEARPRPPERPAFMGIFPKPDERPAMPGEFKERRGEFKLATGTKEEMLERRDEWKEHATERRDEIKANIEERRQHFASTTALRRAAIDENIKEHVIARAEHVAQLLDAMIERLETLADRIEARIDVLEGEGIDVSAAEDELAEARTEISEAASVIEDVQEAVKEALESETPREALKEVKPLGETSKTAIREAHQALMEAVRALPGKGDAEGEE